MEDFLEERLSLVRAVRHLLERGLLQATGGNLSLRLGSSGAFAITPSNYDYGKMEAKDICVLDLDLRPLDCPHPPSIESALHAAVYRERPDVQAVVHTHQVYASALALVDAPIPRLFDEQLRFLGRSVSLIPYAPSGTGLLRDKIAKAVRNRDNAFLMKNHGALVLGTDLERALHNVEILEKCSLAYLLALCTERPVSRVPLAVRELAVAKLRRDQRRAEEGRETRGGE